MAYWWDFYKVAHKKYFDPLVDPPLYPGSMFRHPLLSSDYWDKKSLTDLAASKVIMITKEAPLKICIPGGKMAQKA